MLTDRVLSPSPLPHRSLGNIQSFPRIDLVKTVRNGARAGCNSAADRYWSVRAPCQSDRSSDPHRPHHGDGKTAKPLLEWSGQAFHQYVQNVVTTHP